MKNEMKLIAICLSLFAPVSAAQAEITHTMTTQIESNYLQTSTINCSFNLLNEFEEGHVNYWSNAIQNWNGNPAIITDQTDNWYITQACILKTLQHLGTVNTQIVTNAVQTTPPFELQWYTNGFSAQIIIGTQEGSYENYTWTEYVYGDYIQPPAGIERYGKWSDECDSNNPGGAIGYYPNSNADWPNGCELLQVYLEWPSGINGNYYNQTIVNFVNSEAGQEWFGSVNYYYIDPE